MNSLQYSIIPISFLLSSIYADKFSLAMSESIIPKTPVNSKMTDKPTPSMIDIIFKLAFVNEVVHFPAQSL